MGIETISRLFVCAIAFVFLNGFVGMPIHPANAEPDDEELLNKQRMVYRIKPEKRGGEAFKLIYLVPVPVDVFWRFKTDFHGNFLLSNRYIKEHRLILETGNVTITENSYSNAPNETFRWRTTLFPDQHRWFSSWKTPGNAGIGFTMARYEWNHSDHTPRSPTPLTLIFSVHLYGLTFASQAV